MGIKRKTRKILIFLDFDGVMHVAGDEEQFSKKEDLSRIMDLLKMTGLDPKIVVSSTWRKSMVDPVTGFNKEEAARLLGVEENDIDGCTKDLGQNELRWKEIKAYAQEKGGELWVALDDVPLLLFGIESERKVICDGGRALDRRASSSLLCLAVAQGVKEGLVEAGAGRTILRLALDKEGKAMERTVKELARALILNGLDNGEVIKILGHGEMYGSCQDLAELDDGKALMDFLILKKWGLGEGGKLLSMSIEACHRFPKIKEKLAEYVKYEMSEESESSARLREACGVFSDEVRKPSSPERSRTSDGIAQNESEGEERQTKRRRF